jgi:capsular exopolysaccharide synthesis family protein
VNARDYLALLRERKLLMGACVAIGIVLAAIVTFVMPTKYASTATFYVVAASGSSPASAASDNYQGAQLATDRVKSYTELLTGERVAQDAAAALGGGATPADVMAAVSATSVADTVIITLSATDTSAERAQQIATAVSASFTALVQRLETSEATTAAPTKTPAAQPAVSAQVLQPPNLPDAPVSPSLPLNLAIGLIVGLLAGFGSAVVKRSLDVTVRSAEDLADVVGAPVLGNVPEDRDARRTPVSLASSGSGYARTEAFHRIRTALESRCAGGTDGIGRVLVVTSAVPGEGRTTIACNLAASLAAVGSRVVLVDGDLRRPKVAGYLGLETAPGLTAVLAGRASFANAVQPWSEDGLAVLTSGAPTPRPNELVASRSTTDLIVWLRLKYDYVIIDAPPVLAVADAANLAAHSDGVVLVSRWGVTKRPELESAVSFLRSVSVPVVGAILSRTPDNLAAGAARYGEYVPEEAPAPEVTRWPEPEAAPPPRPAAPLFTESVADLPVIATRRANGTAASAAPVDEPEPQAVPEPGPESAAEPEAAAEKADEPAPTGERPVKRTRTRTRQPQGSK